MHWKESSLPFSKIIEIKPLAGYLINKLSFKIEMDLIKPLFINIRNKLKFLS